MLATWHLWMYFRPCLNKSFMFPLDSNVMHVPLCVIVISFLWLLIIYMAFWCNLLRSWSITNVKYQVHQTLTLYLCFLFFVWFFGSNCNHVWLACVSVSVSVWSVAEGGVSSNLGHSRDGKVNSAVQHREIKTQNTHGMDTYRQAHKRRYLWETMLMWKGQDPHWGVTAVCHLPACLQTYVLRVWESGSCAFWCLCDVPHGRQKDNVTVQKESSAEYKREPRDLSVNFLKVLHLVNHYFH